jgi:hypothetical protein
MEKRNTLEVSDIRKNVETLCAWYSKDPSLSDPVQNQPHQRI